jgi:diguanylate cyclase (GGDEF)-like protein
MKYQEFRKCYNSLYSEDPNKGYAFARKVLNDSKTHDYKIIHTALYLMAFGDYMKADFNSAVKKLKKISKEFEKYRFINVYTRAFNLLGVIEGYAGNTYLSLFYLDTAKKLALRHHQRNMLVMIYSNISMEYGNLKDSDKAVLSLKKSISYGEPSDPSLPSLYLNLSILYLGANNIKKSKETIEYAENKFKIQDIDSIAFYYKAHKIELDYYLGEKEEFNILKNDLLGKIESISLVTDTLIPYETLCRVFLKIGEYKEMEKILKKICDYSEQNPQKDILYFIYSIKEDYALVKGDYQGAYNNLKNEKLIYENKLKVLSSDAQLSIGYQMNLNHLMKENKDSRARNKKLQSISVTDSLTKLLNRHAFNEALATHNQKLSSYTYFGCALMDIDGFKTINDTYGHLSGDEVLTKIGLILLEYSSSEVVFYRYGGDEFVAMFKNMDKQKIMNLLSQICDEINQKNFKSILNGAYFGITCSIGVFNSSVPLDSVEEYLNAADGILYKAKSIEGKGQILYEERER